MFVIRAAGMDWLHVAETIGLLIVIVTLCWMFCFCCRIFSLREKGHGLVVPCERSFFTSQTWKIVFQNSALFCVSQLFPLASLPLPFPSPLSLPDLFSRRIMCRKVLTAWSSVGQEQKHSHSHMKSAFRRGGPKKKIY